MDVFFSIVPPKKNPKLSYVHETETTMISKSANCSVTHFPKVHDTRPSAVNA